MSHTIFTGAIWQKPKKLRSQRVRRVCETLLREYDQPRLGNPIDPLDDLIFIILSNRASPKTAQRTFEKLKQEYPLWDDVLKRPPYLITEIITPAGLANVKSQQIRHALKKIKADFGICDLTVLKDRAETSAQEYLVSLPGVSEKVAKCVMVYTLDMEVLPVDVHVYRVAKRLGWINRKRADQCHAELEALVPPKRRYAFHVDCILHGRKICKPRNPSCDLCCINRYCVFFQELSNEN